MRNPGMSASILAITLALPACATRCDARSACVVGPEHAYSAEQTAHHSRIRVASPATTGR